MAAGPVPGRGRAPAVPLLLPPARDDVPLVAVAHGTGDIDGLRTLDALMSRVRFLRPGLEVRLGLLSTAGPHPARLLAELAGRGAREAVVLPLFLGAGRRALHDLPEAVRAPGPAQAPAVRRARVLGPDPLLAQVLTERLGAVSGRVFGTQVVLVAAGSPERRANSDAFVMAGMLSDRIGTQVRTAFLRHAEPSVGSVLTRLARRGRPVVVASYLLAEGARLQQLQDTAALAGLEAEAVRTPRVAGPLGAHDLVARLLLRRYDQALFG
jgi:sirohydrochlorin ferrochelatase